MRLLIFFQTDFQSDTPVIRETSQAMVRAGAGAGARPR